VIVKRLSSIEDLGAMNVLCIDKTGTLTIDRIILERHLDVLGSPDDEVLQYAYLNSYFQTGLKNLLDAAILEHGELHETLRVSESFRKVDELPFDFGRRRMSVIVEKERQQHELICKGAVEEILSVCSYAKVRGKVVALSPELTSRVLQVCHEMNEEGLRVLAVGYKNFTVDQANYQYRVKDESDLVLAGFVCISRSAKRINQGSFGCAPEPGSGSEDSDRRQRVSGPTNLPMGRSQSRTRDARERSGVDER